MDFWHPDHAPPTTQELSLSQRPKEGRAQALPTAGPHEPLSVHCTVRPGARLQEDLGVPLTDTTPTHTASHWLAGGTAQGSSPVLMPPTLILSSKAKGDH